jgi:catechol 2,3-dioxygenase-like lactoylglutathione lyase family enzyme
MRVPFIDHLTLTVRDLKASRAFYERALEPFGITVNAFHAAALEAGGRDNGEPGRRPRYHDRYYAAYALDPDGNNVEAVCHHGPTADEKDPASAPASTVEEPR